MLFVLLLLLLLLLLSCRSYGDILMHPHAHASNYFCATSINELNILCSRTKHSDTPI
jgi:hypothetical protein